MIVKALKIAIRLKNTRGIEKCQKEFRDLVKNNPHVTVKEFFDEAGITPSELGVEV